MNKTVKRLMGLEIDEVSLVDRPANQHGLLTIAKRDEDENMPNLFDAEDNPVDETDLQVGDYVYDEAGNEFQYLDDDALAELQEQGVEIEDAEGEFEPEFGNELVGVGKAGTPAITGGMRSVSRVLGGAKRGILGQPGVAASSAEQRAVEGGRHLRRNRGKYLLGTGAGTGAVAGRYSKSAGAEVLEELSKALTDDDRAQVIAKFADRTERAERSAAAAWSVAKQLQEERELEEYIEIAKSYGVPGDPVEIGELLYNVAKSGDQRALETLHRTFSASGEIFDEVGYNGHQSGSEVMDAIGGMALETVGKSDLSVESAVVALLEANPEAYDQYLIENR